MIVSNTKVVPGFRQVREECRVGVGISGDLPSESHLVSPLESRPDRPEKEICRCIKSTVKKGVYEDVNRLAL